ncbi:hypothetical protein [Thermococcus peptonophilus]
MLAILVGTQIGAGVLGLPYAASKVGLIPALGVLMGGHVPDALDCDDRP